MKESGNISAPASSFSDLAAGPAYRFSEWPKPNKVPTFGAGVYTIWHAFNCGSLFCSHRSLCQVIRNTVGATPAAICITQKPVNIYIIHSKSLSVASEAFVVVHLLLVALRASALVHESLLTWI